MKRQEIRRQRGRWRDKRSGSRGGDGETRDQEASESRRDKRSGSRGGHGETRDQEAGESRRDKRSGDRSEQEIPGIKWQGDNSNRSRRSTGIDRCRLFQEYR